MTIRVLLISAISLGICSAPVRSDDWPQFRGPARDGVSQEKGWLTDWPKDGLKVLWKVPVGRGYSSVAVMKNRLYTIGIVLKDPAKKDSFQEVACCLDVETGKTVWEFVASTTLDKAFPGSRSTPTVQGKYAYLFGQGAELYCLDAETGKVIWQKLLMKGCNRVSGVGQALNPA